MMISRRGATELSGILVIDKPSGMTSHDVVAVLRRSTGERRIGHAGTLDPDATGVLVVLLGSATRLTPFLTAAEKSYLARIAFGTETDTDDAQGETVRTAAVPSVVTDPAYAATVVADLVGRHEQLPPAYSAIKRGGVTAHRAARAGVPLILEPRAIEVLEAHFLGIARDPEVCWDASFTVSKGTYLRSIARELGVALGTAAHLSALRRTASGCFTLADTHSLEQVIEVGPACAGLFADPIPALAMPVRHVAPDEVNRVQVGAAVDAGEVAGAGPETLIAMADAERLHALYVLSSDERLLRARTVFAGGVAR
jgi:tRNA pseudouridine55 synthase